MCPKPRTTINCWQGWLNCQVMLIFLAFENQRHIQAECGHNCFLLFELLQSYPAFIKLHHPRHYSNVSNVFQRFTPCRIGYVRLSKMTLNCVAMFCFGSFCKLLHGLLPESCNPPDNAFGGNHLSCSFTRLYYDLYWALKPQFLLLYSTQLTIT